MKWTYIDSILESWFRILVFLCWCYFLFVPVYLNPLESFWINSTDPIQNCNISLTNRVLFMSVLSYLTLCCIRYTHHKIMLLLSHCFELEIHVVKQGYCSTFPIYISPFQQFHNTALNAVCKSKIDRIRYLLPNRIFNCFYSNVLEFFAILLNFTNATGNEDLFNLQHDRITH